MLLRVGEVYATRARSRSAAGLRPRTLATPSSKDPGQGRRRHAREQHRNTFGHDHVVTASGFPLLECSELLEQRALVCRCGKVEGSQLRPPNDFARCYPRHCPRHEGLDARVAVVRGTSGGRVTTASAAFVDAEVPDKAVLIYPGHPGVHEYSRVKCLRYFRPWRVCWGRSDTR